MIHHTVGVYNNGSMKHNGVEDADLAEHIEYNKFWRFGRALFVDGVCVYSGYLDANQIKVAEEKIKAMDPINRCTAPYQ